MTKRKTKPTINMNTIAAMLEGIASHLMESNAAIRALNKEPPDMHQEPKTIYPPIEETLGEIRGLLSTIVENTKPQTITHKYNLTDIYGKMGNLSQNNNNYWYNQWSILRDKYIAFEQNSRAKQKWG